MTTPPSPPYIPAKYQGGHQSQLDRIVMHGTVSATECGGALNIARYFQDPDYESSCHYVVDPCSEYQCVWDHTVAWHDGTNVNSIGVELCDLVEGPLSRWDSDEHRAMLERAADLVRQLCDAYDIPKRKLTADEIRAGERGICGHDDMRDAFPDSTTHWDPGAFPWHQFIDTINDRGDTMSKGDALAAEREYWNSKWHEPPQPGDQPDVSLRDEILRTGTRTYQLNDKKHENQAGNEFTLPHYIVNTNDRLVQLAAQLDRVEAKLDQLNAKGADDE